MGKCFGKLVQLGIFIILQGTVAHAGQADVYLPEFLKRFEENSFETMQEIPPKFDNSGNRILSFQNRFGSFSKTDQNFLETKFASRQNLLFRQHRIMAPIPDSNPLTDFFGVRFQFMDKMEDLSAANSSGLNNSPWSGDYWPTFQAGIAARYNSAAYPQGNDWTAYREAFKKYNKVNFDNQTEVDNLSPAEKYDILVNDSNMTLTRYAFNEADTIYKSQGKIETWFGLCHGWAPASYMLDRPKSVVEVGIENFKGKAFSLKFYPDDIKALATMLWANAAINENYYMGGRCNEKSPKLDENGRIIMENCFDVNPGAWHIAVVNQLSKRHMSFVLDASYDAEVWNQPVLKYKMKYFNPETKEISEKFERSLIKKEDFKKDKFKKYRAANGAYVVGVSMELTYISENEASHATDDSEEADQTRTVQYIYDLELNAEGKVIGGEWYQNAHPDFVWTPPPKTRATSSFESYLKSNWSGNAQVPSDWQSAAPMSSTYGQPFAGVVETLIRKSR